MRAIQPGTLSAVAVAASCLACLPARAFQTVNGGTITLNNTGQASTLQNKSFNSATGAPSFPLTPPPSAAILSRVRIIFDQTKFSGFVNISNSSVATIVAPVRANINFIFSGPTPVVNVTSANAFSNNFNLPPQSFNNNLALTGSFNPADLVIDASAANVRDYFINGGTLASAVVNFSIDPSNDPGGSLGPSFSNSQIEGTFRIEYEFVPGPLPILGVGVAFAQSRRLRKRIKASTT